MRTRAIHIPSAIVAGVLASMLSHSPSAQERPATASTSAGKAAAAIVGTWRVSFTRPPSRGYALVTFTSDGTSVRTTDRSPFMSASHGAWVQTGEREFQATWHAFKFDSNGNHIGNQKAVFRVRISADGNTLAGVGIGTSYTLDGKLIESETAEGPFEGTRIAVVDHYVK